MAAALLTVPTVACAACATGWWPHKRRTTTATAGSAHAPRPRTTQPGLRACGHLQRAVQEHARLAWEDKHGRKATYPVAVQGLSVRSRRFCLFTVDNHARLLAKRRGRSIREAEHAARQGQPARRVAPDPTGDHCALSVHRSSRVAACRLACRSCRGRVNSVYGSCKRPSSSSSSCCRR